MTNKQIIIDGVDVSGCAYFWNKECRCIQDCIDYSDGKPIIKELFYNDTGIHTDCETSPNCYYKQLKRAENQIVDLNKMVEAKEQECEKLKKELQNYKDNEPEEKEIQKLYNKFNGNSLIEKRSPYEN